MSIRKLISIFLEIVFITIALAFIFVMNLYKNIAGGPMTDERAFSKENIMETALIFIVVSMVVIPLHIIWERTRNKDNK